MEDALAQIEEQNNWQGKTRLNPCCNGRCTRTVQVNSVFLITDRLNPCCNGRCTRTRCH